MFGVGDGIGRRQDVGEVRRALRWLGAPVSLAALALLALNDHLLKQAAPGLVTGKLSDLAGLVVAPPLFALALAVLRVPRPATVALVATGVGFTIVKTTETGVDTANALWSSVGWSTHILRDPTDLVALPTLLLAAWTAGWARRAMQGNRRQVWLALGAVALPFAVVATAATSCSPPQGLVSVGLLRGDFTGEPAAAEDRIVLRLYGSTRSIGADGILRAVNEVDSARIDEVGPRLVEVCSRAAPQRCWRGGGGANEPHVETSTDGGVTWSPDYAVPTADIEALRKEMGESCGEAPSVAVQDLAVLDTPRGPVVAAASGNAGLLLHTPTDGWTRLSEDDLVDRTESAPTPDPGTLFTPLDPTPTPTRHPRTTPWTPPAQPTTPCATRTVVTVTPDPRNGTPFPRETCLTSQ